ncbi:MAG TPA: methyltransferase domain-containing protein [Terriglobales bacterium]|nr:methyltransferase domain-containing protein [Terriglobales bacterium]
MTAQRHNGPSPLSGYRVFYSQFRKHFHHTGAVAPSSARLARAITAPLARTGRRPVRVLEVGAGTGVFTRAILENLAAGDALDVYEINPAFEPYLRSVLAGGEARGVRCRLHLDDITRAMSAEPFHYIISGLPLNNFPAPEVEAILALYMSLLVPGGTLSYFEYLYIRNLKRALVQNPGERARLNAVGDVVTAFLERYPNHSAAVRLNLPPAVARHVVAPAPGADH